jgi:hypothetical protein
MSKQTLEFQHAQVFLDVVFGVIIGIAISGFPVLIHNVALAPSSASVTRILLVTSALSFCAFYWLEVRVFLSEEVAFNNAVREICGEDAKPVPLTMERYVGSVIVIVIVAAMVRFAESNFFRSFLIANILFWAIDFFGNVEGNKLYKLHRSVFDAVREKRPDEHRPFIGRFGTFFFWWDGLATILVFAVLFVIDYLAHGSWRYRALAAGVILVLTLFRHVVWRIRAYGWWKEKKWRQVEEQLS